MKKIQVKIKGVSPLLCHRFATEQGDEVKKKDKQYDNNIDAENASYKDDKGYYVPSTHIEACLREAAKNFKKGKSTYKETILSTVFVEEEKLYLTKKYDEIDVRPVVIQRNRILKARPRWNSWELKFTLNYDEDRISKDTLKAILSEAGFVKAVGAYRPKFGRFKIEEFV